MGDIIKPERYDMNPRRSRAVNIIARGEGSGGEEVCIKCRGSVLVAEEVGRVLEEVVLGVRKCVYSAEEVP